MTSDEAIKLLLEKFTNLEKRQDKFEARQDKFEAKLDQVITEIKELRSDVNRVEAKVDNVQTTQSNMRGGIKNLRRVVDEFHTETNQSFSRLESEFKAYRRYVQSAVNDIHLRQENTEDQVEAIKDKLDKAS